MFSHLSFEREAVLHGPKRNISIFFSFAKLGQSIGYLQIDTSLTA